MSSITQQALHFNSTDAMRLIQAVAESVSEAQTQRGGLAYKAPTFLHELHKRGFTVVPRPGAIFSEADEFAAAFNEVEQPQPDAGGMLASEGA